MINKGTDQLIYNLGNILATAVSSKTEFPELRLGQAMYNATAKIYPDFATSVAGTDIDCFYDDSKINDFLKAVVQYELNQKERSDP